MGHSQVKFLKSDTPGPSQVLTDQDSSTNRQDARPSVCRNCGAIVGAGETVCPQCGVPLVLNTVEPHAQRRTYDRETMRFARAVLTRPYTFTILFLIANIMVFMLMWDSAGFSRTALMEFSFPVLEAYGAKLNYLINARPPQWWRFVTPIFIHVNLPHILVNMWSLWVVGPYVEKLYGSAKFVVFWVLTGIAGVVASYLTVQPNMHVSSLGRFLFKTIDRPSAGASGALFGLVGVLFVFGIKFRHELPEGFKRAFGTGLLPMIFLNLFIGYLGRGFIDNAAHLGGFFAGAGLALFVGYRRPGERASVAVFWHILQVAALALVAVSFLMVVRNFPAQLPVEEPRAPRRAEQTDISLYLEAMNKGAQAFLDAFNKGETSAVDVAIEGLKKTVAPDDTAGELRKELVSLLERARELPAPQAQGAKAGAVTTQQREKLKKDFQAWEDRQFQWAKENREKYGLKITDDERPAKDSPAVNGTDSNNDNSNKVRRK